MKLNSARGASQMPCCSPVVDNKVVVDDSIAGPVAVTVVAQGWG